MLRHSQQATSVRNQQFKSATTQLDQQHTLLQQANNSSSNIFIIKLINSNLIAQSASQPAASVSQRQPRQPIKPSLPSLPSLQSTAQSVKLNMQHSEFAQAAFLFISHTHTHTPKHTYMQLCSLYCLALLIRPSERSLKMPQITSEWSAIIRYARVCVRVCVYINWHIRHYINIAPWPFPLNPPAQFNNWRTFVYVSYCWQQPVSTRHLACKTYT